MANCSAPRTSHQCSQTRVTMERRAVSILQLDCHATLLTTNPVPGAICGCTRVVYCGGCTCAVFSNCCAAFCWRT